MCQLTHKNKKSISKGQRGNTRRAEDGKDKEEAYRWSPSTESMDLLPHLWSHSLVAKDKSFCDNFNLDQRTSKVT